MKTLLSAIILLATAHCACADNTTLTGAWLNADSKSTGVTRIVIRQIDDALFVSTFGKCKPIDCPWGETPLNVAGSGSFQFGYVNSRGISNFILQRITDEKLELKLTKPLSGSTTSGTEEIINMVKVPHEPNISIKLN